MSTSTDEIWNRLMETELPNSTRDQWQELKAVAAWEYYVNYDTPASRIFEQYVMLKSLIGKAAPNHETET